MSSSLIYADGRKFTFCSGCKEVFRIDTMIKFYNYIHICKTCLSDFNKNIKVHYGDDVSDIVCMTLMHGWIHALTR